MHTQNYKKYLISAVDLIGQDLKRKQLYNLLVKTKEEYIRSQADAEKLKLEKSKKRKLIPIKQFETKFVRDIMILLGEKDKIQQVKTINDLIVSLFGDETTSVPIPTPDIPIPDIPTNRVIHINEVIFPTDLQETILGSKKGWILSKIKGYDKVGLIDKWISGRFKIYPILWTTGQVSAKWVRKTSYWFTYIPQQDITLFVNNQYREKIFIGNGKYEKRDKSKEINEGNADFVGLHFDYNNPILFLEKLEKSIVKVKEVFNEKGGKGGIELKQKNIQKLNPLKSREIVNKLMINKEYARYFRSKPAYNNYSPIEWKGIYNLPKTYGGLINKMGGNDKSGGTSREYFDMVREWDVKGMSIHHQKSKEKKEKPKDVQRKEMREKINKLVEDKEYTIYFYSDASYQKIPNNLRKESYLPKSLKTLIEQMGGNLKLGGISKKYFDMVRKWDVKGMSIHHQKSKEKKEKPKDVQRKEMREKINKFVEDEGSAHYFNGALSYSDSPERFKIENGLPKSYKGLINQMGGNVEKYGTSKAYFDILRSNNKDRIEVCHKKKRERCSK